MGEGFLTESGFAHPGTVIEVTYTFADSFGEKFGADKLTAPACQSFTVLQEMLKPIMAAKATMNFNDRFEVQTKAGSGEHHPVDIAYEVMNLIYNAVRSYSHGEDPVNLDIDNYWPAIRPYEFYIAKVNVKVYKKEGDDNKCPMIEIR